MTADRGMLIKRGRQAVLLAFRRREIPGASPVAYFAGQHRPKRQRKPMSKTHAQDTAQERRLRRAMGYDEIHATQTRPPKFSHPNLLPSQALTGRVHRAMAGLDPLEYSWVKFRYSPAGSERDRHGALFQGKFSRYYQGAHMKGCKQETRHQAGVLVWFAMLKRADPEADQCLHPSLTKYTRPHWINIARMIAECEREALAKIGAQIDVEQTTA